MNDIILKKNLLFSHGYLTKEKCIEIDKNGNISIKKRDYANNNYSEYKNIYMLLVSPSIITDGKTLPIKDPFDEILKIIKYIKETSIFIKEPVEIKSDQVLSNNTNNNLDEEYNKLNHAYNTLALMNDNLNYEYNKIKQEQRELVNQQKNKDQITEINLLKVEIDMYKTKETLSLNEMFGLKNINHKLNEENFNLKEAITNLNQNITILNKSNEDALLKKRIKELEEINKNLENVNKLNNELTNRNSHLLDEVNEKNLDNKKLLMNYTNLNDQYQKLLDKHLKVSELKNISKYFKN